MEDISRFCQVYEATVLDVGGASGYVGDAFRSAGATAVTAEYDIDQMFEHGRTIVDGVIADGCALPIATGSVDVSYSSNVLEHVVSYREHARRDGARGGARVGSSTSRSPTGSRPGAATRPRRGTTSVASGRPGASNGRRALRRRTSFGVSLFRLDVRDVMAWCEACPDVEVLDTFPRYYPRWTKFLVKIPVLREFLTWNLVVVMRRSSRVVAER